MVRTQQRVAQRGPMSKSFVLLAVLIASFAFAPCAWPATYGVYPGLSDMIGNSQAVVVVSIQSGPKTPRTHSSNVWAVQRVKVLSVLMGDFNEQDEIDVSLSPFLLFPTRTYLELGDFPVYERYVLFIAKDCAADRDTAARFTRGQSRRMPPGDAF